jgi:hypothetical protein
LADRGRKASEAGLVEFAWDAAFDAGAARWLYGLARPLLARVTSVDPFGEAASPPGAKRTIAGAIAATSPSRWPTACDI